MIKLKMHEVDHMNEAGDVQEVVTEFSGSTTSIRSRESCQEVALLEMVLWIK